MGVVSIHPDDTYKGSGFNVPEGLAEIIAVKSIVHQFPPNKKTAAQQDPATFACVTYQPLSKDGKPTDEPIEAFYKFGRISDVQPGDADGIPLGDEVGTEGTHFATVDNDKWMPNDKSTWVVYCDHLRKRGVKESMLRGGVLADLVGITGEVADQTDSFVIDGEKADRTMSIFKTIVEFPGNKPATKAASHAAPSNLQDTVVDLLTVIVDKLNADGKTSCTLTVLGRELLSSAMNVDGLTPKQQREIAAHAQNKEFMAGVGQSLGFTVKGKSIVLA